MRHCFEKDLSIVICHTCGYFWMRQKRLKSLCDTKTNPFKHFFCQKWLIHIYGVQSDITNMFLLYKGRTDFVFICLLISKPLHPRQQPIPIHTTYLPTILPTSSFTLLSTSNYRNFDKIFLEFLNFESESESGDGTTSWLKGIESKVAMLKVKGREFVSNKNEGWYEKSES